MSQFQGLGDLAHPTRIICDVTLYLASLCVNTIQYIYTDFEFEEKRTFYFPTTKGSMNAYMKVIGLSISNKPKNHCHRDSGKYGA